jgi:alpha-ribazole phosphatase
MALEIILIRHGETEWNKERVFRGQMDMRMNSTGIAQADATAEALKDVVFDAIYSSPLKRAMVTARRIAMPHEIAVRAADGFSDMHFGSWQGLTEAQVEERYAPLLKKWKESPARFRPPVGESTKKAWKRVNSQLREVLFKRGDIVSIRHDPCAMSVFKVLERGRYEAVRLNDTSHLRHLNLPKPDDF